MSWYLLFYLGTLLGFRYKRSVAPRLFDVQFA